MLLHLAIRQFWREKYSPEFKILLLALALAVFAVTTVVSLTQGLRTVLAGESANLLGADLVLESAYPLDPVFKTHAQQEGLQCSTMVEFLSMAMVDDKAQLASISAFDSAFPLRGTLTIADEQDKTQRVVAPPKTGEIWVEKSLQVRLNLLPGSVLTIGQTPLKITGILQQRPLALSDANILAPTVYMNALDLAKAKVLQPGSRATYRLLLAGGSEQLNAFSARFQPNSPQVKWTTPQTPKQSVMRTFRNAQRYLSVILLLQTLLAVIAVAVSAHHYSMRQQRNVALWRCLGASLSTVFWTQLMVLGILALCVIPLSVLISLATVKGLFWVGHGYGIYAQIGWQGIFLGTMTGLIILFGFSLPAILTLRHVRPLQIIRRQKVTLSSGGKLSYGGAALLLGILLLGSLNEREIAFFLALQLGVLGFLTFALGFYVWDYFIYLKRPNLLAWRFGIAYFLRHKWQAMTQWLVFTLVMASLFLIQILQQDFLAQWREQLPKDTPNYFLINIQPEQIKPLQQWFVEKNIINPQFYPIVRARLVQLNSKTASEDENQNQSFHRPLNVTWMQHLPTDNTIVAGPKWEEILPGKALVSLEANFAQRQGLKIGDEIHLQIAQENLSAKIAQLRTVEWESFKPNFFIIFPEGVLDQFPHSYITSFYLDNPQQKLLVDLAESYPEISILAVGDILEKVREIIDKVVVSLSSLLLLVFLLGILIMYATILSTMKERLQESATLQILGAHKKFILKVLLTEFGALAGLSVIFGSFFAVVIAYNLASYLDVKFSFHFFDILWAQGIAALVIILCGLLATRKVFRILPLQLLRQVE